MVKEQLDPERKVYVEYSNEVWNSLFPQTRYSWEKAKELGLGPKERPWEGGGMYYAQRSVEIFKIWEEVFGGARSAGSRVGLAVGQHLVDGTASSCPTRTPTNTPTPWPSPPTWA